MEATRCPLTDEWIKKLWYTYTMEYYSAIKRNKTVSFAEMWIDLETVIQNEVSQKEKKRYQLLIQTNGIYKNVTNAFICRATVKMQT